MDQADSQGRVGVKIERPPPEKVSFIYVLLVLASFALTVFTAWILVLEWTGQSPPAVLKFPIT